MNRKKIKILAVSSFLILGIGLAIWRWGNQKESEYLSSKTYCVEDSDCALYECFKCANKTWIDFNIKEKENCTNNVPGLVGCECGFGICVRRYKK